MFPCTTLRSDSSMIHFMMFLYIFQMPLVQAIFESNVVQLTELIGQREDANAMVHGESLQAQLPLISLLCTSFLVV